MALAQEIIYSAADFAKFKAWLHLNEEGLTWQGRYQQEFNEFWQLFFIDGIGLAQVMERFTYAHREIHHGPLHSWFGWLRDKFLCFTFINWDVSVLELAAAAHISLADLASVLRNFFLLLAPDKINYLDQVFLIGHVLGDKAQINFKKIDKELCLPKNFVGSADFEIMPEMEITLYDEWHRILGKMKQDFFHYGVDLDKVKATASFKGQLKLLREVVLLVALGLLAVWGVRQLNVLYEKHLADRISIYGPQFSWDDQALSFKWKDDNPSVDAENIRPQLEVNKMEAAANGPASMAQEKYNEESDVVLTSWDALPRDFNIAEMERSDYEEMIKGGYRDYRFGSGRAFRVMMNSADLEKTKRTLAPLLTRYNVDQADNVRPGTNVPGGIYYNLFVPTNYLKEFLAQVIDLGDAVLYESRTPMGSGRPGTTRVGVWVKSY
ncbi:MAG: hypothetical protein J6Y94_03590 [Bacteriovoracaceae bacterium]|nr:hypothetical protein [Bacteriovoracaceae bacterium]